MRKRATTFGILAALTVISVSVLALALPGLRDETRRGVLFGGALLDVRVPQPDQVVGQGGVAVLIQFPHADRTLASSLRCLLNGEDVTSRLTLGGNGAAGSVWAPTEGEHTLRIEVFGRSWWQGPYFEDWVQLKFRVRRNPSLDRAGSDPGPRFARPA